MATPFPWESWLQQDPTFGYGQTVRAAFPGVNHTIAPPEVYYSQGAGAETVQPLTWDTGGTLNYTNAGAGTLGTITAPAVDRSGGTKGNLGGQLGTQSADPTRNIGRNPDGSIVPVNHNPDNFTYNPSAASSKYNLLPEWSYGGDQIGGAQYVEGRGWVNPTTVAAGTDIGINSGTTTGIKLPVAYNGAADTARWELNGKVGETSWSKVVRYTNDAVKNGLDPIAAMNNAIAIVNRDAKAQGKTSGFEAAATTGAPTAPGTQQAAGTTGATGGQTQTGGTNVAGLNPGTGGGGSVGVGGQTVGAGASGPIQQSGGLGQFQFGDMNRVLEAAKGDAGYAAQILDMASGRNTRTTSQLGKYMDNVYGKALQAYLSLAGLGGQANGGIGTASQGLQDFYNHMQGGDLYNFLGQQAARIPGADFGTMNDADVEKALRAAAALQSLNYGSLGGARLTSGLDDLSYQNDAQQLAANQGSAVNTGNLVRLLQNSGVAQLMQQYGGMR